MSKKKELNIKDLKKNEKGEYILPLLSHITWGKKEITELHLSEPRAKHLRGLSSNPGMSEILDVIAELAGQPSAMIDELSMGDTTRCTEFFGSFE